MHVSKPTKVHSIHVSQSPVETVQKKGGSSVSQMQLNTFQLDMNLTFPFGANVGVSHCEIPNPHNHLQCTLSF